jgi:hypothetical protein
MINKTEALLDSIAALKGWSNPDSVTYAIRNPLHIKSFARPGKHEIDEEGRRIFTSWLAGYKACLFDLDIKIRGESRAGIREGDKLSNLLRCYGIPDGLGHDQVVKYLRRALKDQSITKETPLSFFRG